MRHDPEPEIGVLYVTGEESERQLKLRAQRLGVENEELYVLAETELDSILAAVEELEPEILIMDSIQTMSNGEIDSAPGSITQVRECTMRIMRLTKEKNLTVFVVGHITKEGSIAGPKVLEHMVDCVLYFEGERNTSFRILRAAKNRFGSTNEIGVFEMDEDGLRCVENPSELLLSGRPENSPGTCVACVMEGTRPLLAEVQALVTPAGYNAARRSNGIDYNRAAMLLAVLEKRGGLPVGNCDAYINVIGGLDLDEPAADLATVLAVASSYLDRPLGSDLAAIGEVGKNEAGGGGEPVSGPLNQVSKRVYVISEGGAWGAPSRAKNEAGAVGEPVTGTLGRPQRRRAGAPLSAGESLRGSPSCRPCRSLRLPEREGSGWRPG